MLNALLYHDLILWLYAMHVCLNCKLSFCRTKKEPPLPPNSATFWQPPIALPTSSSAKEKEVEDTVANDTANLGINTGRAPQQPSRPGHPWRLVKPCSYIDLPPHPLRPPQRLPPPTVHPLLSQLRSRHGLPPAQRLPPPVPPKPRNLGINNHGRALQQPSREDLDSLKTSISACFKKHLISPNYHVSWLNWSASSVGKGKKWPGTPMPFTCITWRSFWEERRQLIAAVLMATCSALLYTW